MSIEHRRSVLNKSQDEKISDLAASRSPSALTISKLPTCGKGAAETLSAQRIFLHGHCTALHKTASPVGLEPTIFGLEVRRLVH